MKVNYPVPVSASKTFTMAKIGQQLSVLVAVCGALGGASIFGAHPLDLLMPEIWSRRVQASASLVAAVGGILVVKINGDAKDGRRGAERPVYDENTETANAISPIVRPESSEERHFFESLNNKMRDGETFGSALKGIVTDTYRG